MFAAFEISRRILVGSKWYSERKVASPQDIADIFIPLLRDETRENFLVVCLNSANKIIRYETISIGKARIILSFIEEEISKITRKFEKK